VAAPASAATRRSRSSSGSWPPAPHAGSGAGTPHVGTAQHQRRSAAAAQRQQRVQAAAAERAAAAQKASQQSEQRHQKEIERLYNAYSSTSSYECHSSCSSSDDDGRHRTQSGRRERAGTLESALTASAHGSAEELNQQALVLTRMGDARGALAAFLEAHSRAPDEARFALSAANAYTKAARPRPEPRPSPHSAHTALPA